MLTITPNAVKKILELLKSEPEPDTHLRIFVQGGGCSGFSYGFTFDDVVNEDDFTVTKPGVELLVDSMSMQYLTGAVIDYQEDVMGSKFVIKNPNAVSQCGCGSSFSI